MGAVGYYLFGFAFAFGHKLNQSSNSFIGERRWAGVTWVGGCNAAGSGLGFKAPPGGVVWRGGGTHGTQPHGKETGL